MMKITADNVKSLIKQTRCAKQDTIAIIVNRGKAWIGSNWCSRPQEVCPREGYESGQGYDKCYEICGLENHAEVDACRNAGIDNTVGGVLYLVGHTYCCNSCKRVTDNYGIRKVFVGVYPPGSVDVQNANNNEEA